jgi:hypothetical protein
MAHVNAATGQLVNWSAGRRTAEPLALHIALPCGQLADWSTGHWPEGVARDPLALHIYTSHLNTAKLTALPAPAERP